MLVSGLLNPSDRPLLPFAAPNELALVAPFEILGSTDNDSRPLCQDERVKVFGSTNLAPVRGVYRGTGDGVLLLSKGRSKSESSSESQLHSPLLTSRAGDAADRILRASSLLSPASREGGKPPECPEVEAWLRAKVANDRRDDVAGWNGSPSRLTDKLGPQAEARWETHVHEQHLATGEISPRPPTREGALGADLLISC